MTNPRTARDADGFFSSPWTQAALTGALTLIPARNYPRWLRRTLIWSPPVAGAIGFAYLAASPEALQKLSERYFDEHESTEKNEDTGQQAEGETTNSNGVRPLSPAIRGIVAVIPGVTVGTAFTGMVAVGFWADEKIDRGLRKLKVPLPRVVMGCAAGALTWREVANHNMLKQQQKAKAQATAPVGAAADDANQFMRLQES